MLGALAINSGEGHGADLDPESFRYRLGVWIEYPDTAFLILAVASSWPVILLQASGLRHAPTWVSILGFLIAGFGWIWLWDHLLQFHRDLRRMFQR